MRAWLPYIRVFGGLRPCLQGLLGHLPTDLRESATRVHRILGCRACGQPIRVAGMEIHYGWRHIDLKVSNPVVGFGKARNNGQSECAPGAFLMGLKCEQERTQPQPGQSSITATTPARRSLTNSSPRAVGRKERAYPCFPELFLTPVSASHNQQEPGSATTTTLLHEHTPPSAQAINKTQ